MAVKFIYHFFDAGLLVFEAGKSYPENEQTMRFVDLGIAEIDVEEARQEEPLIADLDVSNEADDQAQETENVSQAQEKSRRGRKPNKA